MTKDDAPPIRVLLADDHPLVRVGLEMFLNSDPRFEVVGHAGNGKEAIEAAAKLQPDVICLDILMPVQDGISAIPFILEQAPKTQILMLTSYIDMDKVVTAIRSGAAGYLMKDATPNELARAIQAVARGEMYLHRDAARKLSQYLRPDEDDDVDPKQALTSRELEVLALVARGLNNQDIADDMGVSLNTVKAHLTSVLHKLGLTNRVQAAIYALQHEIVSLDDL